MEKLTVDVVSAEASLYSGTASFVVLPGECGELGILPGHVSLVSPIRPGGVRIDHADGSQEHIFVAGGLLEVHADHIMVMADTAIRGGELDEEKARAAQEKAQATLAEATDRVDIERIEAELQMLRAQLAMVKKLRKPRR
ncbi:MAG: F0F1 ATP synthase subunit epsilon [Alcaligenaceae bacterium]|nr:F0F1 ATP synthase subunit epsilon [Alcaligenaceae bacterium]